MWYISLGSTLFSNRLNSLLKHPRPKVNTFNLEAAAVTAEAAEETGGEVMNGVSCPNGSKLSKKMEWRGLGWQMSCPTLQIPHHMNAPLLLLLSSTHTSNSCLFSAQSSLAYGFTLWQNQFRTFAPSHPNWKRNSELVYLLLSIYLSTLDLCALQNGISSFLPIVPSNDYRIFLEYSIVTTQL